MEVGNDDEDYLLDAALLAVLNDDDDDDDEDGIIGYVSPKCLYFVTVFYKREHCLNYFQTTTGECSAFTWTLKVGGS